MKTAQKQKSCHDRVNDCFLSRREDLITLLNADDNATDDLGALEDYGLSFDYVAPNTFSDQKEGYYRYQISYGGPSEEFRIFVNLDRSTHRVEFWLLDWSDGAGRLVSPDNDYSDANQQLWDYFGELIFFETAINE